MHVCIKYIRLADFHLKVCVFSIQLFYRLLFEPKTQIKQRNWKTHEKFYFYRRARREPPLKRRM